MKREEGVSQFRRRIRHGSTVSVISFLLWYPMNWFESNNERLAEWLRKEFGVE